MKRNYKLVILISAVALLMSLLAVLPAMGADAALRFPDPADLEDSSASWVRQGGNLILEVADSDLDVGADTTITAGATCTVGNSLVYDRFTATTGTPATSTAPIAPPILDRNGDLIVNFNDVLSNNVNLQVESVDPVNGAITIRCIITHVATIFTLTYKQGAVDKTNTTSSALEAALF